MRLVLVDGLTTLLLVEPTDALRSIETALRLAIFATLGDSWLQARGAPDKEHLTERRDEEAKRRDGAVVSKNLLDYAETYHLTGLIKKNWDRFQPIFKDAERTRAFFGVIEDVRNSVAHGRDLVPFERDLISGIAGQIRNQVSLYRSEQDESSRYYPKIESLTDNFGYNGLAYGDRKMPAVRLEVGDVLTFDGRAFNAKGSPVTWQVQRPIGPQFMPTLGADLGAEPVDVGEGDSATFRYVIREEDVHEQFVLVIRITTTSQYHRHRDLQWSGYDDRRYFVYAINPPPE